MGDAPALPEALRRAVVSDLRPVRPLPAPGRRALTLALWVPVAALAVLAVVPLREDAASLGWLLSWGVLFLEAGAGLVLVALSLADAVPGRGPTAGQAVLVLVLAALAFGAAASATSGASPGRAVENPFLSFGPACLAMQLSLGLSALVIVGALVVRAAPLRARWTGVLGGAGSGLMAESVYRLHCPVSDLRHVLPWHGGAVLALALLGMAAGLAWDRRELSRMASRHPGAGGGSGE